MDLKKLISEPTDQLKAEEALKYAQETLKGQNEEGLVLSAVSSAALMLIREGMPLAMAHLAKCREVMKVDFPEGDMVMAAAFYAAGKVILKEVIKESPGAISQVAPLHMISTLAAVNVAEALDETDLSIGIKRGTHGFTIVLPVEGATDDKG